MKSIPPVVQCRFASSTEDDSSLLENSGTNSFFSSLRFDAWSAAGLKFWKRGMLEMSGRSGHHTLEDVSCEYGKQSVEYGVPFEN